MKKKEKRYLVKREDGMIKFIEEFINPGPDIGLQFEIPIKMWELIVKEARKEFKDWAPTGLKETKDKWQAEAKQEERDVEMKQDNQEWEEDVRKVVEKHILPRVKATNKEDKKYEETMVKLLAYDLGLDEIIDQWTEDLKPLKHKWQAEAREEFGKKISHLIQDKWNRNLFGGKRDGLSGKQLDLIIRKLEEGGDE